MESCKDCDEYRCNRTMVLNMDEKEAWDLCFLNPSNCIGTDKNGDRVFVLDQDIDNVKVRVIITDKGEGSHEEKIVTEAGRLIEHTKKTYETIKAKATWNLLTAMGFIPIRPRWQAAIVAKEGDK